MGKILSFRDLIAWQKAMDLADAVYDATEDFPPRERFGLAYQMRKAAVSIPSNIAEGHRRRSPSYIHFLEIALGSHGDLIPNVNSLPVENSYLSAIVVD